MSIFTVFWKIIIYETSAKREELEELIESCAARGKPFFFFTLSEVGVTCVPYYIQHIPIVFLESRTHEAVCFSKTHYFQLLNPGAIKHVSFFTI